MINPTEYLYAVYRKFAESTCGVSALRDIYLGILYGYIDCLEAAKEWRDILVVHLDEPSDFEFFKVLRLDTFWQCLGVPGELPDYPAPWDAYLERLECGERYKSLFVGSE